MSFAVLPRRYPNPPPSFVGTVPRELTPAMNALPPTTQLTRDQFLAGVRKSGVLTDRQFDRAADALTPFQKSAREVADFFVTNSWLTRFQAERLLHGKPDGFLLGPYVVQDYITKSATGRAYKAKHRTMNRAVAVLVLKSELTSNETVREAIRTQARAAARLAHPNVLTLLDVNTAGERMYLVHEFVDGTDAGGMVMATGPLSVAKACEFVRQAAVGLQHAHDKHTPHGRLSPAALQVGRPGGNGPQDKPVVKVSGLGLGDIAGVDRASEYAAPELAADPTPTPAADLFALGGVLHFLLTGKPPHPTTPLHSLRADVPAPLLAVVAALLHPNPAFRPASANQVADAVAPFASDDSAFIDFTLPASGPISATAISGSASGPHLPVGIPLSVTPPPMPPVARSPFADLGRDEDTPTDGQAVYTPVHTVRSRRGTRARKQEVKLSVWVIVTAAAVLLATAAGALAVLASVVKG
jgi:eukaryotic-like serine/threonine-protein kinase